LRGLIQAMGEFASVVIASAQVLPPAAAPYRDALFFIDEQLAGGWHIWAFNNTGLAEQHTDAVLAVQRDTHAPALVGQIIDSSYLLLTGMTETQAWDVILPPPDDPDMARAGLSRTAAASVLRVWATHAGLTPDAVALTRVTSKTDYEAFAGWAALEALLPAFGLKA
jgi:hypothetical protein